MLAIFKDISSSKLENKYASIYYNACWLYNVVNVCNRVLKQIEQVRKDSFLKKVSYTLYKNLLKVLQFMSLKILKIAVSESRSMGTYFQIRLA